MTEEDAQIIKEFLVESRENLDRLDRQFVQLEQDRDNREVLASIFRTVHSIKGVAGFLGLKKLEQLAHAGENLLALLRDGKRSLDSAMVDALLQSADGIRAMLDALEGGGDDGENEFAAVKESLRALVQGGATPSGAPATTPSTVAPAAPPAPTDEARAGQRADSPESVRVDVSLLDRLMNLTGELVLVRNQIIRYAGAVEDGALNGATQRLNLITTELQGSIMKTRMQPIKNVWGKFPRLVRDLGMQLGKKVRLEMDGAETELDRTLIEAIKDPMTHLVRNAVDHGLEAPAQRLAAGKPEEGVLRLKAYHEGGRVNIEISDDGHGLNPQRLKEKAVQKGLLRPDDAERMGDGDLYNLIFLAGFSTVEQVSNLSGRGVGMDVVKTNIDHLGGSVELDNLPGRGLTVRVRIPLTLAIIPALMVGSGGNTYAIPQVSLMELVRVDEEGPNQVECIQGASVFRLRGHLLPLVYLAEALKIKGRPDRPKGGTIVVLRSDGARFGVVVEDVWDTEEVVVKPLGRHLKSGQLFAGSTILGDGRVALILDVLRLADQSGVADSPAESMEQEPGASRQAGQGQALLLLGLEQGGRAAMPLRQISRLEEIAEADIERSGGQELVKYRGGLLPLIQLPGQVRAAAGASLSRQVVVLEHQGRRIGLSVERIIDIVEASPVVDGVSRRHGVTGSAVIAGKVTDLLDLEELCRLAGTDGRPVEFQEAV
jgi:two-component system chemotaxis sensor kinase CheA